jgi:hypothetical protein
VGELVGGGRNLRADDVEHSARIQNSRAKIQKGFGHRFTQMKHRLRNILSADDADFRRFNFHLRESAKSADALFICDSSVKICG